MKNMKEPNAFPFLRKNLSVPKKPIRENSPARKHKLPNNNNVRSQMKMKPITYNVIPTITSPMPILLFSLIIISLNGRKFNKN